MVVDNNRGVRALLSILQEHGTGRFVVEAGGGADAPEVRVHYGKAVSALSPVWAGEGFPKDVDRALQEARRRPVSADRTLVVVARRMSRGARDRLAADGLSWADEQGGAAIAADPGLLVVVEPARRAAKGTVAAMRWSDGAGAVAECLLQRFAEAARDPSSADDRALVPPVAAIADEVGISAPLVSRTLQQFDTAGWTAKVGPARGTQSRRHLTDATGMLSAWAGWHSDGRGQVVRAHAVIRDADDFVTTVIGPGWSEHAWALTGWLALDRRAPFSTTVPVVELYLERDAFAMAPELDRLLDRVGLRRVESGARVHVLEADRHLPRLLERSADPHEVSDIRLYGDLLRSGVRGSEAAEHLRETRIGF